MSPTMVETAPVLAPQDLVLFGSADPFALGPAARAELALTATRTAVERHLAGCPQYAGFAERRGFDPAQLVEPADIALVPQIPVAAFKRGAVASVPMSEMARRCTSSGTRGTVSEVWRDRSTVERLLGSVRAGTQLIRHWYDEDLTVVNLGPDHIEAGDLWFAYVMSLVELLHPTEHAVRGGRFDPAGVTDRLAGTLAAGADVALVGPPALVLDVARHAQAAGGLAGGVRMTVVTAGGWKRDENRSVEPGPFRHTVTGAFGLAGPHQVRDAFNQVELNTVLFECAGHRKHIPPWLTVIVRDPADLRPVPAGTTGLLSYVDPTADSYPCFIVGDDLGSLDDTPCPCGANGPSLRLVRRLSTREQRGCALKLSGDLAAAAAAAGHPAAVADTAGVTV